MHAQGMSDTAYERAVLTNIVTTYPGQIRLSELVMEMTGDSEDDETKQRINIEDALRELRSAGLVWRSESVYYPTRAAIRAFELFVEAD
jgi:ElaB/YqjD/DUF883 family membrane-anchored ribosome-binding protein